MLKVDLGELARKKRVHIDAEVTADDPLARGAGFRLIGPLALQLDAQAAAHDVVVLGRMAGVAEIACRRCLSSVRLPIDEAVTALYRAGVAQVEAEAEEIYSLPERGHELDLTGAIREHLLLAVPEYVECREACKGLCPHCGANLNETTCNCAPVAGDDRWAALRALASKKD